MGVFDDCKTEQEVKDKLNALKTKGPVTRDVEWEAEFRILEVSTLLENLPGAQQAAIRLAVFCRMTSK